MKKVLLVVCVLALLSMTAAAYATTANWNLNVKAFNLNMGSAGAGVAIGFGTASTATATFPSVAGQTAQAATLGGAFYNKQIVAPGLPFEWDLQIGARTDYDTATNNSQIKIAIWNNQLSSLNIDQALDTNLVYVFKKGQETLAWFSTVAHQGQLGMSLGNWNDISQLLQVKGWNPSSSAAGWTYTDTVTTATGFAGLGSYSFTAMTFTPVPEPGSLMALGTGLIGLAGFAIRRRK